MSVDSTHPLYDIFAPDWVMLRDFYKGERAVKARRETYLPATQSMHLDGMAAGKPGYHAYQAYLSRAVFPDFVTEGVEALVGMIHRKPAVIEVPEVLKPLLEKITLTGESCQDLLRAINYEQLLTGRVGLLADLPAEIPDANKATVLPYVVLYNAETIRNWDETDSKEGYTALNLVVLDESGYIRDSDFKWKEEKRYRVLQLGEITANEANQTAEYSVGVFSDQDAGGLNYDKSRMAAPVLRGKTMSEIPFVFANTKDIISTPDDPPLIGLGRLCLTIYRSEADYRQGLFMTGQDTLVVIGGTRNPEGAAGEEGALRVGANSRIDCEVEGDAKYIGVNSKGLTEQREALRNDRGEAHSRIGRLIPVKAGDAESGEALKTRIAAQTASLTKISQVGAKALENILKLIATWCNVSESEVEKIKVEPNTEFGEFDLKTTDIVDLMTARSMGAVLSRRSIHDLCRDRGYTKLDYEEEKALVEEENAEMPPPSGTVGGPDPKVDPHLTDEEGSPMNKDTLEQEREKRAEQREIRAEKRNPPAGPGVKK